MFIFIISNLIIINSIYLRIISPIFNLILNLFKNNICKKTYLKKRPIKNSSLSICIGIDQDSNLPINICESGLYQNFLITGGIGSGKTSSAMYPFTNQLLKYNYYNPNNKIGMLILDVKGNYCNHVIKFGKYFNLTSDIITIKLKSNIYYNPLHKPHLKPQILANRLKTILLLFSENNSDSYWLDTAEQILTEFIKLCRIYNNGYVTFLELHKLINDPLYYKKKISILKDLFIKNKLSTSEIYELNSALDYIQNDFEKLDSRTKSILISEISRITNIFVSDFDVVSTFSPPKEKLSFTGFSEVLDKGKIVILDMNISEYSMLSKIIAAYLKLDFQSEVISNLSKKIIKTSAFICDEYDKYATKNDSDFFSLSREAKCINIISTQSYSSLKSTLKDDSVVRVITQNLVNKIWFRNDDSFTIEEAQKQLGKEDKERISRTISESAARTNFSYITNSLDSENSNISESFNSYYQTDYIYDTNFFTQKLETFTALTFLSNGTSILPPKKTKMLPYFKNYNL